MKTFKQFHLTCLVTCMMAAPFANAADSCLDAFKSSVVIATSQKPSETPTHIFSSEELQSLIQSWKFMWQMANQSPRNSELAAQLDDEISKVAATLVQNHQNAEFFNLAREVAVPLNRRRFYGESFAFYGQSILEIAILSKNYEVFRALRSLPTSALGFQNQETPKIRKWYRALAAAVAGDPVFAPQAASIPTMEGAPYHPRIATFGRMHPQILAQLTTISITRDIEALRLLLSDLFPHHSALTVQKLLPKGNKEDATFLMEGSLTNSSSSGWLSLRVLGSTNFLQGMRRLELGGNLYVDFEISTSEPGVSSKANASTVNRAIQSQDLNWIEDMEVDVNRVRILIKRDKSQLTSTNHSLYQELTLFLDSSYRIVRVRVSNGNRLLFKNQWATHEVEMPEAYPGFEDGSLQGEND